MLSSAESHNYHLIINMLLGNNTFDWLICPLHVNVKSALQSAMPWYLTNLSSMETGDWVLEGRSRGSSPSQGEQLRQVQQRHRAAFAGLGYEGIEHSPVPNVQFTQPS